MVVGMGASCFDAAAAATEEILLKIKASRLRGFYQQHEAGPCFLIFIFVVVAAMNLDLSADFARWKH